ncbi:MAG TPA: response regulator transcription factor [Hyphomicrobiales bacterium]|jgi:DNA-binding NarL/FixJ family response regulator
MKVLIADDHGLYRAGLGFLLKDRLGVDEVIEVGSLDEALDVLALNPGIDLALFDLSMPGMAGPDSLGAVKAAYPASNIAVISGGEDRENVLKSISAGLSGYIPKSLSDDEIAKALEMMLRGYIFVPTFMATTAEAQLPPRRTERATPVHAAPLEELTPRQRDVLHYIVQGRSNKEIARELDIAEGTVKIHLAALFVHFGAHNRTELATRAQGLLNGAGQAMRGG